MSTYLLIKLQDEDEGDVGRIRDYVRKINPGVSDMVFKEHPNPFTFTTRGDHAEVADFFEALMLTIKHRHRPRNT